MNTISMTGFATYKDEEEGKNNMRGLIGIFVLFFILALGLIWLSFKVNSQMMSIRSNFRTNLKWGLIILFILTCIIGVTIIVLNSIGKKKSYDTHWKKKETDDEYYEN